MLRDAIILLSAFVLGVLATLFVIAATGGFYEYRFPTATDVQHLVNDEHWEIANNPRNDGYYYLRRPRLRF